MICDTTYGNVNEAEMDAFAAEHNSRLKPGWLGTIYGLRKWDIPMAFKNAPIAESDTVLDVGCGESLFLILAAERGKKAWGIDSGDWHNFEEWFQTLTYFAAYRGDRKASFRRCSAANMPFPDAMFDKVFTFSAFEHFKGDDDICAAKEVARVLRPGGLFCGTMDFNPHTERPLGEDNLTKTYTLESFLSRIVKPSGLRLAGHVNTSNEIIGPAKELFFLLEKSQ